MPKQLIYKLKIDGSYERDTIPMQRLSEYMSDLAALLGEPTSVHFADLEAGSAVLSAAVDTAAIPKVMERVTAIGRGEAPDDLRRAFSKIDKKLYEDNAIGSLSAYLDKEAGAVVLDFPGREGQMRVVAQAVRLAEPVGAAVQNLVGVARLGPGGVQTSRLLRVGIMDAGHALRG